MGDVRRLDRGRSKPLERRGSTSALISLVLGLVLLAAAPAHAQSSSDALLDDAGPGWTRKPCPGAPPTDTNIACFTGPSPTEILQINATAMSTADDARTILGQLAAATAGSASFDTGDLDAAKGIVVQDGAGGNVVLTLLVAGQHNVFSLGMITQATPEAAAAFLIDVGRRQQERDGGPPSSERADPGRRCRRARARDGPRTGGFGLRRSRHHDRS
jgi:hypothetical protein